MSGDKRRRADTEQQAAETLRALLAEARGVIGDLRRERRETEPVIRGRVEQVLEEEVNTCLIEFYDKILHESDKATAMLLRGQLQLARRVMTELRELVPQVPVSIPQVPSMAALVAALRTSREDRTEFAIPGWQLDKDPQEPPPAPASGDRTAP